MSARQTHNLLIVESHTTKDVTEVGRVRSSAARIRSREATVGDKGGLGGVSAAGSPRDLGTTHLFNGGGSCESPQIGVGHFRVLLLDRLEEIPGTLEASIGTPFTLRGESHMGSIASTSSVGGGVCAGGMPSKTHESGGHASAIPTLLEFCVNGSSDIFLHSSNVCGSRESNLVHGNTSEDATHQHKSRCFRFLGRSSLDRH
mmetsp:Transcript_77684/g.168016  ORF Transcript_77684/g.168016 Transcript_77684/m.168016 type:complete len:202 (-) Transcript_77684:103-708(-)